MANSWGFDGSQLYPPHFCSWAKVFLGWSTPTVINAAGEYTIDEWALNNEVYRIDYNFPSDEYLLIENRQPSGVETAMPQGGLAIFHIDDAAGHNTQGYPGQSGWPGNGNHYRVALLQADGDYDLEQENNRGDSGDVYHAGGVDAITPDTVPSTDAYQSGNVYDTDFQIDSISSSGASMTFRFGGPDPLSVSPGTDLNSGGPIGGPFSPASQVHTLLNSDSGSSLDWTAAVDGASGWVTLSSSGGTLAASASTPLTIGIDATAAALLAAGEYSDSVTITNTDTGATNSIAVSLTIAVYWYPLDTSPGWTTSGLWNFGTPSGGGGAYGNPDPTSGASGSNVYGYNLSGDYENSIDPPNYLTTGDLNFFEYENVTMSFKRWLGVESPSFDHATLEISVDGAAWSTVWQNPSEITDSAWQTVTYDISAAADFNDNVKLRWGMGTTDGSWQYCGWNIDDIAFYGDYVERDCTAPPVITLNGGNDLTIECGGAYVDAGATAGKMNVMAT